MKLVPLILLLASACTLHTTARVDVTDAAAHFSTDEALEESAVVLQRAYSPTLVESTYTTLCGGKECSGTSMKYTQAFREVASLAIALRALQELSERGKLTTTERLVLQDAQRSIDTMRHRVDRLHATFEVLDPRRDFELDRARQRSAESGLERAREQVDEARALVRSLQGALSKRIGDASGLELGWEEARPPEDPRVVLKRRVADSSELARELAEQGDSIDALIDTYGEAALDRRLRAAERRQAAVQSVSTTRAYTQLELTNVAVSGPLLPEVVAEWFSDTQVVFASCLSSPRAFEVGLLYGPDGVVAGIEVIDDEASLTACARDGLVGTALTGTPLPSGGVITLKVEPQSAPP